MTNELVADGYLDDRKRLVAIRAHEFGGYVDRDRAIPDSWQPLYAADNPAIKALVDCLAMLAKIPIEDFSKQDKPEYPLMGWNGHILKVSDVLAARAALAPWVAKETK